MKPSVGALKEGVGFKPKISDMLRSRRVGGSMHATEKKTERFSGAQGSRPNRICRRQSRL